MCGITGFIDCRADWGQGKLYAQTQRMAATLMHRGPDKSGVWLDPSVSIGIGHSRLSVIDLSEAGHQPMVSRSQRFVFSYNGELYNADELRCDLRTQGCQFRGYSDTEVFLEACAVWGVEQTLARAIGMFAFALWDREERRLTLARDRLGIKPLYWLKQGGLFAFGSELRALRAHNGWNAELNRDALALYVRHSYFPSPYTVYRDVQHLPPGTVLTYEPGGEPKIRPYWSLAKVAQEGQQNPFDGTEEEAVRELEALLSDAVTCRMVADVPLGAFLSGGYDSSTVAALMQANSSKPVRTFSIGFYEKAYNEAHHAKAVASHLGTEHTEFYVSPEETRNVIPKIPEIFDEPFSDSSQIPTYLVSALARDHVTVALSGDGGDELFAGYNRYAQGDIFRRYIKRVPQVARRIGTSSLQAFSPALWDKCFKTIPSKWRPALVGEKIHKLASVLGEDGDGYFVKLTSQWQNPEDIVIGAEEPITLVTDPNITQIVPDFVERMQYRDTLTYLPGDILTKVDRTSMAVALEARVPLLDHRVVEYAWRLPLSLKLRKGERKWILRQVLYKYLPPPLVDRPKMGFGVPIDAWLKGPLRDWAEDLLSEHALRDTGVLNPAPIRTCWSQHLSGMRNSQHAIWSVLMFQAWHHHNRTTSIEAETQLAG